jgi:hypothetical protein
MTWLALSGGNSTGKTFFAPWRRRRRKRQALRPPASTPVGVARSQLGLSIERRLPAHNHTHDNNNAGGCAHNQRKRARALSS